MLNLLHKDADGEAAGVSRETQTIVRVPLDRIADNPFQYRQAYHEPGLLELATNIHSLAWQLPATSGLQQPGLGRLARRDDAGALTPIPEDYGQPGVVTRLLADPAVVVQIAYGHRRLRAFRILAHGPEQLYPKTREQWPQPDPAEYGAFPLQIAWLDDQAMAEFALTENSQREDVSAIEEAALLQRMIAELSINQDDVGRKFGWSRSTVANKLRLLRLPVSVRNYVVAGDLTEKHARTLLRIEAAPDVLAGLADKARSEMWTTRRLDEKITEAIRELRAVPDAKVAMLSSFGGSVTCLPPWDLNWSPTGNDVRGACAGCAARVTFGNEPAPRCVDKACWIAKGKLWGVEDERRQRAAARAFLAKQNGADMLVNVLNADGVRPVPLLEKSWEYKDKDVHVFSPSNPEEAVIIDLQLCGPHCKCFAACYEKPVSRNIGYEAYRPTRWRPCPDDAPDVAYCCTDVACVKMQIDSCRSEAEMRRKADDAARMAKDPGYAEMRRQREERDATEQKQRQENKQQAQRLVDGAVTAAGGVESLWSNKGFLIDLAIVCAPEYYSRPRRSDLEVKTVDELRATIMQRVTMGQFASGGLYDITGVQSLANRIAPPKPQPAPGDSQATDWQAGWNDDDECAYQDLLGQWDGGNWTHLATIAAAAGGAITARTLLRLVEACPDKTIRGQLWQQHNSLPH